MPDNLLGDSFAPRLSGTAHPPKQFSRRKIGGRKPRVQLLTDPIRDWNRADMATFADQIHRRGLGLRRALVDSVGYGVAQVPVAPTGLGLLPPPGLAFRLSASMLAVSYSRVRSEPTAADRTWSLPGRG